MLFGTHKFSTKICGFCNSDTETTKIELFGFKSTSPSATICSNCLIDTITKASFNKTTKGGNMRYSTCNICGNSPTDFEKLYVRGGSGICTECITYLLKTSLTVGKTVGVENF